MPRNLTPSLAAALLCAPLASPRAEPVRIPATTFTMGSSEVPDEPRHELSQPGFWMDSTEVSIDAFEAFAAVGYQDPTLWSEAGGTWLADHQGGAGAELRAAGREGGHPVVAVTWYEADAYCRWRGGRLPTEPEWELGACGGHSDGVYPWGPTTPSGPVWYEGGKAGHVASVATQPVDQSADTTRSPYGLHHVIGNVWEWTADWYHRDPEEQPVEPEEQRWKTLRGGSFMNLPSYCTCTHREPAAPTKVSLTAGFRCAYDTP